MRAIASLALLSLVAALPNTHFKNVLEAGSHGPRFQIDFKATVGRFQAGLYSHNKYYGFNEIVNSMTKAQTTFRSGGVTFGTLGRKTAEGRGIPFVKVAGGVGTNKKKIFIEAGIHGREWIGPAAAVYFLDRLLSRRNLDNDASYLFNNFDWYIVPVANPDGYEFTRSSSKNRMWRKNRRYLTNPECSEPIYGVDINRNFDVNWSKEGASKSCGSDTYHGPAPFSEPEAAAIRDKVQEIRRNEGEIAAYISLNAYGQHLATPYAYTDVPPPSNARNIAIGKAAAAAIKRATGADYTVGSASDWYKASGTSTDWAYVKANIKYSLSFSLRPKLGASGSGFNPPASEIVPTGIDVWAAMNAIARRL